MKDSSLESDCTHQEFQIHTKTDHFAQELTPTVSYVFYQYTNTSLSIYPSFETEYASFDDTGKIQLLDALLVQLNHYQQKDKDEELHRLLSKLLSVIYNEASSLRIHSFLDFISSFKQFSTINEQTVNIACTPLPFIQTTWRSFIA